MLLIKTAAHIVTCSAGIPGRQIIFADGSRSNIFATSEVALNELNLAHTMGKVTDEEVKAVREQLQHLNLNFASEILEACLAIFEADALFLGRREPIGPSIMSQRPNIVS